MKTWLKVVAIALVLLVAGIGGAFWWLTRPVELKEFEESIPLEVRQRNSDVQTALLAVGIESSLVDMDAERAYVAYDLPEDGEYGSEELQMYALGILAGLAKGSATAIIVQYVDEQPALAWEADLAGARAVQAGTADEQAYLLSIVKTTF